MMNSKTAVQTKLEQWAEEKRAEEVALRAKYPFIPQNAKLDVREYDRTLQAVRMQTVEVRKSADQNYKVYPVSAVGGLDAERAVEMSAELLTAASIAQQLNSALESERAIQEGA